MDYTTIITAIGSVGFPIVACCWMFTIYQKQLEAFAELKDAINALTNKLD